MYQLEIISKIQEPEPDGIIHIRQGESVLLEIDNKQSVPSDPLISGRPVEWRKKTIPALIIAISDSLHEIFQVFQPPKYPEYNIPFLAISSDKNTLLKCRAEGKIFIHVTSDCPDRSSEAMHHLEEVIGKTEYCFILCSQANPEFIQLAGEIANFGRKQNTLMVLSMIGKEQLGSSDTISDSLGNFHSVVLPSVKSDNIVIVPIEQIRDFCEATIDSVVAKGWRSTIVPNNSKIVRELLFHGGLGCLGWHMTGNPDAQGLINGYVELVNEKSHPPIVRTYTILKVPFESTLNEAYDLFETISNILFENVPSQYPHEMKLEAYNPELEGQYDLSIWTFSGEYKLP